MLKALRTRLTYANVVATLALFVALGGSSYAALKISGREIKAHTITGQNIKRNSLGRRQIKESSLSAVPRALQRRSPRRPYAPNDFLVRCPQGTIPVADVCIETQAHSPAAYGTRRLRMRQDRHTNGSRASASHPQRADDGPHPSGDPAGGWRRADQRSLRLDQRTRPSQRPLHHRQRRRRRPHSRHRCRSEVLSLRSAATQLRSRSTSEEKSDALVL